MSTTLSCLPATPFLSLSGQQKVHQTATGSPVSRQTAIIHNIQPCLDKLASSSFGENDI